MENRIEEKEFNIHIENMRLHIHTENHCDCDHDFSPTAFKHKHNFAEVFICGEGTFEITAEKERLLKVSTGDVLIIPPGIIHNVSGGTPDSRWFVVDFLCEQTDLPDSEDLYSRINALYSSKEIIKLHGIREYYSMAESIFGTDDRTDSIIGVMRLAELLLRLSGVYAKEISGAKDEIVMHKNSSLQVYKRLDILIHSVFRNEDAGNIIAKEMFMSSRQLDRISKQQYGMTLHQIITENRMNYAQKCLENTDMPVEKIAYSAGFSSRNSFYRAFVEKNGCTPVEYRKQLQNEGRSC